MTILYIILITISVITTLAMLVAMLNMIALSIPLDKTNNFWEGVENFTDKILDAITF